MYSPTRTGLHVGLTHYRLARLTADHTYRSQQLIRGRLAWYGFEEGPSNRGVSQTRPRI
jgi:hypothetical protein